MKSISTKNNNDKSRCPKCNELIHKEYFGFDEEFENKMTEIDNEIKKRFPTIKFKKGGFSIVKCSKCGTYYYPLKQRVIGKKKQREIEFHDLIFNKKPIKKYSYKMDKHGNKIFQLWLFDGRVKSFKTKKDMVNWLKR